MILISESKLKELQSENATLRARLATYEQVELPEGCSLEQDSYSIAIRGPVSRGAVRGLPGEPWQLYQYIANALRKLQEEA